MDGLYLGVGGVYSEASATYFGEFGSAKDSSVRNGEEVRCYGFSSLTGSDSVLQMDQWYLQPKTNPLVKNHKTWEVNLG